MMLTLKAITTKHQPFILVVLFFNYRRTWWSTKNNDNKLVCLYSCRHSMFKKKSMGKNVLKIKIYARKQFPPLLQDGPNGQRHESGRQYSQSVLLCASVYNKI